MIGFQSDEAILQKLRERLRRMTDEELVKFGKQVRKLAENPFQRQVEEARREWKRRKQGLQPKISTKATTTVE
jgi:phage terminase small subunit